MRANNIVERALSNNDQARNSDKILLLQVWHDLGLELTREQQTKFLDLPSPETIRRIRHKLQEAGRYLADEEVRSTRQKIEKAKHNYTAIARPEHIEELMQGSLI